MTTTAAPSNRVLWVTGAGSGMGRAVAVSAASAGYRVALSGRRANALEETAALVEAAGGSSTIEVLDATDLDAVASANERIHASLGPVTDLVLSAGLNHPKRYWRDQSMADFRAIVDTNLVAAAGAVDAVLPGMREVGGGTITFVSSYSGWSLSPHAGVAYSASKTALGSLSATLNEQENANGIRACHLCPGDVDSEFLSSRPNVPDERARATMLTPEDIADAVQFVLDRPASVCINELVITPTKKRA